MTNAFYFKINLNKYGDLKIQTEREKKQFIQAVVIFAVGILILLAAHFYISSQLNAKVANRQKFLKETQSQIDQFRTSGDYLSSEDLDRLGKTFSDRIFWANKLVALSQEIDQKLAVRKFTFGNGVLTLNGITPVDSNVREIDLINEFIMRLKSNPEISNDFPYIKSGVITKQVVKDTAIMEFVIECYSQAPSKIPGGEIQ